MMSAAVSRLSFKAVLAGVVLTVPLSLTGLRGQPSTAPTAASMTMALTGDSIITQRLAPYREPEFLGLIELLRNADLAFTNFEMLIHDYEGYPSAQSGGTYMRAGAIVAKDLAWAGIDLVSLANNHTGDYTHESIFTTARGLEEAGLVHAGTGENLQQAREARYADTPAGRVALISTSSSFPVHSRAGHQRSDVKGRPGLNPLRFETKYVVDQPTLGQLRNLAGQLGMQAGQSTDEVRFLSNRFVAGTAFAVETTPLKQDYDEIMASIRDAKMLCEYVIVSVHSHEAGPNRDLPAQFYQTFARGAIDAGASVVVGHGPHYLKGIEIYKGKPIFYSLGNFIYQNDTVQRLPTDNYDTYGLDAFARISDFNARRYNNDTTGAPSNRLWWESVVAMPVFRGDRLTEVRLQPVTLGFGRPSGRRGRPKLADAELSKKIIDDLIRLSEPFGTKITFQNGVGVIAIPQ